MVEILMDRWIDLQCFNLMQRKVEGEASMKVT